MFNIRRSLMHSVFVLAALLLATLALTSVSFAQGPTPPAQAPAASAAVPNPGAPIGAQSVANTSQWDTIAANAAKSLGFSNYVYEAWQLSATSTWDDTFNYYNNEMTQARWSGNPVVQQDIPGGGGKVAAWLNPDGKTGLVIVFVNSPDGTQPAYDFAIFGETTPAPVAQSDWTSIAKTAADDQEAASIAQAAGFPNYVYQQWQAPAALSWDQVFKYYSDQMTQGNWSGQAPVQKDANGIKLGVWLDPTTSTGLVLVFQPSADGTQPAMVAAIVGLPGSSAPSTSPSGSQQAPSNNAANPVPSGKSGYLVKNYYGQDINFNINNTLYTIPANGQKLIILDPGKYNWSANIPGKGSASDTVVLGPDDVKGITFSE